MILLDTHALVWLAAEPTRLSRPAATAIRDVARVGGLRIATVTLWELAALFARGRLQAVGPTADEIEAIVHETAVEPVAITPRIAAFAVELPATFPADPADRLIAATARVLGAPLVTRDTRIRASKAVQTIW